MLVMVGCGYEPDPYACATDDGIFPGERLNDWKSYADHVALVRVESGREEGVNIVLRLDVLDTYFTGRGAPELPGEIAVSTRAFMLEDRTYVTPLIFFDAWGEAVWITQTCEAPLPIDDGRVEAPERKSDGYKPLREVLAGTPADDFPRLMREARVDPDVAPYLGLRPAERSRRVYGGPR